MSKIIFYDSISIDLIVKSNPDEKYFFIAEKNIFDDIFYFLEEIFLTKLKNLSKTDKIYHPRFALVRISL